MPLETAFRFLKQQLGWDKPMLRDPAAADRWTWLILACYVQLCLARAPACPGSDPSPAPAGLG